MYGGKVCFSYALCMNDKVDLSYMYIAGIHYPFTNQPAPSKVYEDEPVSVTSFPELPTVQFLITCSMQKQKGKA